MSSTLPEGALVVKLLLSFEVHGEPGWVLVGDWPLPELPPSLLSGEVRFWDLRLQINTLPLRRSIVKGDTLKTVGDTLETGGDTLETLRHILA
ncbi:hypothetical protein Zmor_015392 [Zophobas morio]|uniref:Uncharacterized protein n=1 Tax=Zophobas morio TaxID=2755281 RepID=A0AA38ILG0_9CUCU|nr:hypothetical protein Zmor_015392 [Zophobas morio]